MEFTYVNDDGEEIVVTFPTIKAVCSDCNGEGTHLCPGMRGHAYSAEEFQDSFDEEDREEYFKRGGKYDVTCETCHGDNVVDVINEDRCTTPELVEGLKAYHSKLNDDMRWAAEVAAERRMGC